MNGRLWFAGLMLAAAVGCPGTPADEGRIAERLARALEGAPGTVDDCAARLAALGKGSDELVPRAEATLGIVGLYRRLRAAGDGRLESACGVPLRAALWELALRTHKQAQKNKGPGDGWVVADALYRAYLDQFPAGDHAVEGTFYYAELLWVREQWRAAADQYTRVAEKDPAGKFARDAAYAAVLARKNALGHQAGTDGGAIAAKPFSPDEQALLTAFDLYLQVVPAAPERAKIEFQKARMHYEHNLFDQAVPLFAHVVEAYPSEEIAIYSANLLLDSLNVQGRTKRVREWVTRFRNNPDLMKDAEFARQMRAIDSDGLDLDGRRAYKEKAWAPCARAMMASAQAAPEHPKHAERLFNAVNCYNLAGDRAGAHAAGAALLAAHPDSPLAARLRARPAP
jgi:TolA-binding protein